MDWFSIYIGRATLYQIGSKLGWVKALFRGDLITYAVRRQAWVSAIKVFQHFLP